MNLARGTGTTPEIAMKSVAAETEGGAWTNSAPSDIESECEIWDWARTAGVSAAELRAALRDSLAPGSDS